MITEQVRQAVKRNHHGVEDFTVLTPRDVLDLFYRIMNLLTTVVVGSPWTVCASGPASEPPKLKSPR